MLPSTFHAIGGQFLYLSAQRGLQQHELVVIAMWQREAHLMTPQYYREFSHSDGDVMAGLLAFRWDEQICTSKVLTPLCFRILPKQ